MSWLARSIANSLRLDEDGGEDAAAAVDVKKPVEDAVPQPTGNDDAVLPEDRSPESALSIEDRRSDSEGGASDNHGVEEEDGDGDYDQGCGVKEDLSEFQESLTRQFWGVASFLAPPPQPPPLPPPLYERSSVQLKVDPAGSADADEGVEEELVEYDDDERESGELGESANQSPSEEAVGITEEVLAFARNIAHHPETWLDFPIEEEEFDDFHISEAQYKHALAVEYLAPRLAALRYELCPVHMGVGYFWMVYFVLLNSRLNKHDAGLLSSPQLVQARAMWMHELQKRTKRDSYWSGISAFQSKGSSDSPRESIVLSYDEIQFGNESECRSVSESSTQQIPVEQEVEKHVLEDGRERKEEASLPPDYVSLAKLREQWLRKQEELKLKQKREEEEEREREAKARAQDERSRNQRGPAKIAGAVGEKRKGKEIVSRGPGNGGDGDNTRRRYGSREESGFKGAAAVEKKEGVGIGAEVLSGGDGRGGVEIAAGGMVRAGISSREGGCLGVVQVLPRNREVADVKRADLRGNGRNHRDPALVFEEDEKGGGNKWIQRGGGRGRGRGRGRNGVNELRQTEPAVNLEKNDEGENGRCKKWLERGRERGGNGVSELKPSEPKINLEEGDEKGTVRVNESKQSEPAMSLKEGGEKCSGKKWLERGWQRGGNGGNELKESEPEIDFKVEEGSEKDSSGVRALKQSEPSMNLEENGKGQYKKWKGRAIERDRNGVNELKQSEVTVDMEKGEGEKGRDKKKKGKVKRIGGKGLNELKQTEVALDLEKEEEGEKGHGKKWNESGRGRNGVNELKQSKVTLDLEEKKEGENGRDKKWKGRVGVRGRNEVNGLKQNEVALDLEKEEEGEKGYEKKGNESGRGRNGVNELKLSEVELDLEKDEEFVRGGGEKLRGRGRGRGRGRERGRGRGSNRGFRERIHRLKEFRPVVRERSEVESEVKNKGKDEISEVCSEITRLSVGDTNGIQGPDNKAKDDEDGVEGKDSNGLKVAVEIEKVDHEVLSRKYEYQGYGREYPRNGNRRGGFWRGRRYTRAQKPDRMSSIEMMNMVWVKKEDKLDA